MERTTIIPLVLQRDFDFQVGGSRSNHIKHIQEALKRLLWEYRID